MQGAPRFAGIGNRALEKQCVVQAESGGERDRDQVEQTQRNAADTQHGDGEHGRQRHRREHMPGAMRIAKGKADREYEQQEGHAERLQDAHAVLRDEGFGFGFQIQQAHRSTGLRCDAGEGGRIVHTVQRGQSVPFAVAFDQHGGKSRAERQAFESFRRERRQITRGFHIVDERCEQAGLERQVLQCRIQCGTERRAIRQPGLARTLGFQTRQPARRQFHVIDGMRGNPLVHLCRNAFG